MLELMPAWVLDGVRYVGFPALIFAVWYLSRKDDRERWSKLLETMVAWQKDQAIQTQKTIDQHFELYKQNQETVTFIAAVLSRLEQKIDTEQYCPWFRNMLQKDLKR